MHKLLIVIAAACLVLMLAGLAAGCDALRIVVGSGNIVNQHFALTDFTRVSIGWNFKLEVKQGATYSVDVSVDDNIQSYLEVAKDGDTLKIGLKNGYGYNSSHLSAVVTLPELAGLTLSGASNGTVSGFKAGDDFALNVSGASHATLTGLVVKDLTLEVSGASRAEGSIEAGGDAALQASGASTIELTGKCLDADVEISGASTGNLVNFSVKDAHVDISGASNATLSASGTISGDVSGASHLYYTGTPTLGDIQTSGASSVGKK